MIIKLFSLFDQFVYLVESPYLRGIYMMSVFDLFMRILSGAIELTNLEYISIIVKIFRFSIGKSRKIYLHDLI